jgi:hypothetical protein
MRRLTGACSSRAGRATGQRIEGGRLKLSCRAWTGAQLTRMALYDPNDLGFGVADGSSHESLNPVSC